MVKVSARWRQGATSVVGSVIAVSLLASCSRTQLWIGGSADAPSTWGDFAATLDVPDCPSSNPVLMVNTTADELDGGQSITDPSQAGDYLSFAEAIWIAGNRGTPHNVFFDADVFPATTPGVIAVGSVASMPTEGAAVCLDGRLRGVVLEYQPTMCGGAVPAVHCELLLRDGSLVVGLTFDGGRLRIVGGVMAGCYVDTTSGWSGDAFDATIGPGNVYVGTGLTSMLIGDGGGTSLEVRENYFGYDPLQRAVVETGFGSSSPLLRAIRVFAEAFISDNVFCVRATHTIYGVVPLWMRVTLVDNAFGVDRDGTVIAGCEWGLDLAVTGPVRVGPGNVLRGLPEEAVRFGGDDAEAVELVRNVITGNGAGIVATSVDAIVPLAPTITHATSTLVTGDCAQSGRIEVFSDPGDQGETFLGETTCNAGVAWSLAVAARAGPNATATLTVTTTQDALEYVRTSAFSAPVAIQ